MSDLHIDHSTVVFLTLDTMGGGAERSAELTVDALSALRAGEACLISVKKSNHDWDCHASFAISGIAPTWPRPVGLVRFALFIRRIVGQGGVSCLVTNSFGLSRVTLTLKATRLINAPVIVVERNTLSAKVLGTYRPYIARFFVLRLTRWLYTYADAIVGVSNGVSRDLEHTLGLPAGSVTTIYNPVDTKRINRAINSPIPEELEGAFDALPRPVVLATGRLVAAKAHHDLLEAFAQLPIDQRGSLVILGEGPLREDLEQHAGALGVSDRVWMPGFVENPWWFIARSDVFALSSRWEGHPRALLEALVCNIPIASTDCPSGPREILGDTSGTRLTPVGDTQALAEAIANLLSNAQSPDIDLTAYEPAHVAHRYREVIRSTQESVLGLGSSSA